MVDLGNRITTLRNGLGMSQEDLAAALEVSRQSVSKWETGASVPELGKLVRMSELFGVTLDELVKGESPERDSELQKAPQEVVEESPWQWTGQKVAGVILLCFGGLIFVLLMAMGGLLGGLILSLPFFGCGLICLLVKQRAGLWCGWACFLAVELFLRQGTWTNWTSILTSEYYLQGWYNHLALAWGEFLVLAVLVLCTVRSFRDREFSTDADGMWKYAATWGGLVIDLFAKRWLCGVLLDWFYALKHSESEGVYQLYLLVQIAADYIAVALVCALLVQTAALIKAKRGKNE